MVIFRFLVNWSGGIIMVASFIYGGIAGVSYGEIYSGIIEESMQHLSVLSSQVEEGGPPYPFNIRSTLR